MNPPSLLPIDLILALTGSIFSLAVSQRVYESVQFFLYRDAEIDCNFHGLHGSVSTPSQCCAPHEATFYTMAQGRVHKIDHRNEMPTKRCVLLPVQTHSPVTYHDQHQSTLHEDGILPPRS